MKIEGLFLPGRVARRIFAMFVLSAVVPALALAVLTLSQVRTVLVGQSRALLVETSKAYALNVYERMLMAQGNLVRIAADLRQGIAPSGEALKALEGPYVRLAVVGPGVRPKAILGEAMAWPEIGEAEHAHLAKGESVLIMASGIGVPARILLLHSVEAGKPDNFALIGEINPAMLWGDADSFPYLTGLCVFADTGAALFCSQPELGAESPALARHIVASSSEPRVRIGEEQWLMGHWQLFLKPKLFAPYWTAAALEPESVALAPVTRFTRIFVGVVLLALLLAAFLSARQIRRTMGPLGRLMRGTRLIAAEDFKHRVIVESGDEFAELATSFNDMAARLGRQIGAQKVLSRIDQLILSNLDMDPVFRAVLLRIRDLVPDARAGVVVLEPASDGEARAFTLNGEPDAPVAMTRFRLSGDAARTVADRHEGCWLDEDGSLGRCLPRSAASDAPPHILPIRAGKELSGFAYLFAGPSPADLPADILAHLRDLGDRVGVALSAVAREEQLIYQARHDDLTGLPNRLLFKERLLRETAFAQRENRPLALLYIDLDRFKSINDSLGHSAGDALLGQSARRLRGCVREGDTVARLGGDEFALILPGIAGAADAAVVAEKVLGVFSQPFVVAGQESFVAASVGITIFPADGQDGEDLLRKADTAMYRAKDAGGGKLIFFEEQMNAQAIEHQTLEREMRQGLARHEFLLHYQPKLDLRSGRVSGAEALVRWNHPTRGLVPPGVFIGVAEETGIIEAIGNWVIFEACAQHAAWRQAGAHPPRIAVNVSGRQFQRGDLVQIVEDALRATATPASALEIEVTESLFLDQSGKAIDALRELRRMGLEVAIDDFGTGYSSMGYLKRLPVDVLKLDRSFVTDLVVDDDARVIAQAIIALAHALRLSVVAEGVETAEHLELLRSWSCDTIQGYHFSRPLAPRAFFEFFAKLGGNQPPGAVVPRAADTVAG